MCEILRGPPRPSPALATAECPDRQGRSPPPPATPDHPPRFSPALATHERPDRHDRSSPALATAECHPPTVRPQQSPPPPPSCTPLLRVLSPAAPPCSSPHVPRASSVWCSSSPCLQCAFPRPLHPPSLTPPPSCPPRTISTGFPPASRFSPPTQPTCIFFNVWWALRRAACRRPSTTPGSRPPAWPSWAGPVCS